MTAPVLFDSHLHLTAERFAEDRQAVMERAREGGVVEMVTIASDVEDARAAISLASETAGVWATAGLHPHEADQTSEELLADVERLAEAPEVVAIGETGLDFHYDNAPRDAQLSNFRAHLELASRLDLPIVVHSRSAETQTVELLEEYGKRVSGVLHCFSGGDALLASALDAGWYVSFSGLVTFVEEIATAVPRIPRDRILVETDAPYLAPAPKRGRRNEPAYLVHTCRRVGELRGWSLEEAARTTTDNARRFYGVEDAS